MCVSYRIQSAPTQLPGSCGARTVPRCAGGCTQLEGLRGLCKVFLAATSCSGAFQPPPVVLLLTAMWGLFQTFSLPPCFEVVFWSFLPWQTAWILDTGCLEKHVELFLFNLGLCAQAQILQLLNYSWCHVLGSFDVCLEQRVPVMSGGTGVTLSHPPASSAADSPTPTHINESRGAALGSAQRETRSQCPGRSLSSAFVQQSPCARGPAAPSPWDCWLLRCSGGWQGRGCPG